MNRRARERRAWPRYRFAVALAAVAAMLPLAAAPGPATAGLELGFEGGVAQSQDRNHDFREYSLLMAADLPWTRAAFPGWSAAASVVGNVGILNGWGSDAGFVSVGPALALGRPDAGFSLHLSSGPALMTRDRFGGADFGMRLQFMTRAGFSYRVGREVELGYAFQHMSNGNLARSNPGLDMHLFELGVRWAAGPRPGPRPPEVSPARPRP